MSILSACETRLTPDLYPADFSWVPNWGDEGERDTNDTRSVLISGICERSVQIDFDELVTSSAVQHLYNLARSDDKRPYFLQVSYTHPHEPYLCRPEYWHLYDDIDIPLPHVPALPESEHDAHSVRLLSDFTMLNVRFADEDILRARRAYYGSISYLDQSIGKLLDVLDATGMTDNTAIIFTSDHGEMLGERGMWFKKHFFESSIRVPLLMKLPDSTPGRVATPVSLVDLLPTFMGIAKESTWESPVEHLEGTDLTALSLNPYDASRAVYAEYLAEATTAPIFMIRRGEFKFVGSKHDPALLFNVANDPHERSNLAQDPDYAELLQGFLNEMNEKWNSEELTDRIKLSQVRRRLVLESNQEGETPRWNHDETPGEKVIWYRGEEGYNTWAFAYLPVAES